MSADTATIETPARWDVPARPTLDPDEARVWTHLELWCQGRGRAKSLAAIAHDLDLDRRKVHDIVKRLQRNHYKPVVSACDRGDGDEALPIGTFVATSSADVADYQAQLESRFAEMSCTLRAVKLILARWRGQQDLFSL